jgi:hypothetical protein
MPETFCNVLEAFSRHWTIKESVVRIIRKIKHIPFYSYGFKLGF